MASPSSRRSLLLLLLFTVLAVSSLLLASASKDATETVSDDLDEDLSFLEEDDEDTSATAGHGTHGGHDESDGSSSDGDENDVEEVGHGGFDDAPAAPEIDETDVVILKEKNFSDFIGKNRNVMVEFYAPWCGHCKALAPEYAAAATALRGEEVALAKVDATEERELAKQFEVQGFPTVLFFVDGAVHKDYQGDRTKEAIVTWIKKTIGSGVENITTAEEAEKILASENKIVLGYLKSLVGADSEEFSAASKLEDRINFYQTDNPDVAKLFHIDPNVKRPFVVLVKKEAEKISYFDGQFSKSAIVDFVIANKLPLVNIFTWESAPEIFDSAIKHQLFLFSVSNETEKVKADFQEAAKHFKGKLSFVYVERDNEDFGVQISEYFGISGEGAKVMAYSAHEGSKKYFFDGEITADNIKKFAEDFLEGRLEPFYRSAPLPETNDGDVKIVVGKNFDDIVLDESKDVLLEIYAPWCGHCQALEPIYNKLAKHLRNIESLVIAKMDGTTNEHPRVKAKGFPTLLFFPAGNKSLDPIDFDADRTVVAFYKFIKKHAAIPFKLQRPSSTKEAETTKAPAADEKSATADKKDEL